jgi:hypothetical protein
MFLLEENVTGAVTWVGTCLTLVGLYITYKQAVKARKAAQAASDAVNELKHKFTASNVLYANAQLAVIRVLVENKDFRTAIITLEPAKKALFQICHVFPTITQERGGSRTARAIEGG